MPHRQSLSALNRMLATGGISSTEITTHFLDRIEKNQQLNAFVSVDREQTLARAQQADHSRRNERNLNLKGLPVALKDIFCTQDLLTSCGSRILSNFVSPYDATVVERLDKDGFIVLGKTNMDEFAMGSSNESSYFGPVSTLGIQRGCLVVVRAARQQQCLPDWHQPPSVQTPEDQFGSQPHSAA